MLTYRRNSGKNGSGRDELQHIAFWGRFILHGIKSHDIKTLGSSSPNISFGSWIRNERYPFLWRDGFESPGTCLNECLCERTIRLLSAKNLFAPQVPHVYQYRSRARRDFPHKSRSALRLAQRLCNRYLVSSPGVKRQGRGVAHPTPFRTDVRERVQQYLYFPNRT